MIEKTTIYQIDLDVDSDNENDFEFAGFTDEEDKIENSDKEIDEQQRTGKIILPTSQQNSDSDEVPDYADGFNLAGAGSGKRTNELANVSNDLKFIPVQVELKEPFDPEKAKIKFIYDPVTKPEISDDGLELTGAGTEEDPYMFTIKKGGMRLWKKKPTERTSGNEVPEGDFIPADKEINWSDITEDGSARIAKLYLEYGDTTPSEAGGKKTLTTKVKEGEEVECEDKVNMTLLPVEFITPAGDPVKAPVDAGDHPDIIPDGANEFTYSKDEDPAAAKLYCRASRFVIWEELKVQG